MELDYYNQKINVKNSSGFGTVHIAYNLKLRLLGNQQILRKPFKCMKLKTSS